MNKRQVKRWVAFLRNHKDDIAAMNLFTAPPVSLRLLYGFFVIEHGRRHIVHFNATFHPTAAWVIQQLREAFPYDTAPRYLIFDRDSIFSPRDDVLESVESGNVGHFVEVTIKGQDPVDAMESHHRQMKRIPG